MDKDDFSKNGSVGKSSSRRDFLKTTSLATAAFTIIPSVAMGRTPIFSPEGSYNHPRC